MKTSLLHIRAFTGDNLIALKNVLKIWVLAGMLWVISSDGFAQNTNNKDQQNLIATSQSGASPLFFYPGDPGLPVIHISDFSNSNEFSARDGLPNLFSKLKLKQNVTIGYLGGSITRSDNMYRVQSLKFIQNMCPDVKITGINAGISGTGADLGACRLYDQLLQYNPDLVFVEFAVNRAFSEGVEGIIRQIWQYNPKIDICLIYTISEGQAQIYAEGGIPQNIRNLDLLAEHYAIPSVHMGIQAGFLEKQDKLVFKGNTEVVKDKIVFSADGIHPTEAGGNLYAEAIARAMLKMKADSTSRAHVLPNPLLADNWEDARMIDPLKSASFDENWETINPAFNQSLKQYTDWFPFVMKAKKPGSSFSFQFDGSMFGLFDIGGPEVGQLEIEMDGQPLSLKQVSMEIFVQTKDTSSSKTVDRFNQYCNNRYRGQCVFIKVCPGKHQVKIIISKEIPDKAKILGITHLADLTEHPEKYNQTVVYLGKILIRGKLSPLNETLIN